LQEKNFQHCFNQWKIQMERFIKREREKEKNVKLLKLVNKKFVEWKSRYLIATPCMYLGRALGCIIKRVYVRYRRPLSRRALPTECEQHAVRRRATYHQTVRSNFSLFLTRAHLHIVSITIRSNCGPRVIVWRFPLSRRRAQFYNTIILHDATNNVT